MKVTRGLVNVERPSLSQHKFMIVKDSEKSFAWEL